jgi:hypothetical protein
MNADATVATFQPREHNHENAGEYEGLYGTIPSSYWNYDFLLRTWLTKRGPGSPVALTLLAYPIY